MTSPFHEGEQRVQTRLGVREAIEPWAQRVVRPCLPEEHRAFYAGLPFVVLAARDAADRPWATLLTGEPGFLSSPDARALRIASLPSSGDALADALRGGEEVGLLGIELHTRRRNRMNGTVAARDGAGIELSVGQSFGNCPQHITHRRWRRAAPAAPRVHHSRSLAPRQRAAIEAADTFFIASGYRGPDHHPGYGMDASHRGGPPGFVRVRSATELVFPDFSGNNHFNTLGNLELDPRVGLLFVDFEGGHLLQLTGRAAIDWNPSDRHGLADTRRLVHIAIDEVRELEHALPLRWEDAGGTLRDLRVAEKREESGDVASFELVARDGGPLPSFHPGQYLPIELDLPGQSDPVRRTYSLSGDPARSHYRISVKRDPRGLVSRHLHDALEPGAILQAGVPEGQFQLDVESGRPVVLASAGIGLTPLVSMLHHLADSARPVWFLHGARDGTHLPLFAEVTDLAASAANVRAHLTLSRPRPEDRSLEAEWSTGRLDASRVAQLLPDLDADFYLCGPPGFMAGLEKGLLERGVPPARIFAESFGPSALSSGSAG